MGVVLLGSTAEMLVMKSIIVPGVIARTQLELEEMLGRIKGKAERVMLDVMDGEFVPSRSLDFDFKTQPGFEYEAHLMVARPLEWMAENSHKVEMSIIHVESVESIERAVETARSHELKVALALKPETGVEKVLPYLSEIDAVVVLTVEPGSYCVEFLPETLEKIRRLRELNQSIPIEADGCMSPEHVKEAKEAGATIFASGSYIMKSPDPGKAIRELEEAATG